MGASGRHTRGVLQIIQLQMQRVIAAGPLRFPKRRASPGKAPNATGDAVVARAHRNCEGLSYLLCCLHWGRGQQRQGSRQTARAANCPPFNLSLTQITSTLRHTWRGERYVGLLPAGPGFGLPQQPPSPCRARARASEGRQRRRLAQCLPQASRRLSRRRQGARRCVQGLQEPRPPCARWRLGRRPASCA